ncbi:MAG: glucosylglycerol hydrolase [Spirochaetia bacterium]
MQTLQFDQPAAKALENKIRTALEGKGKTFTAYQDIVTLLGARKTGKSWVFCFWTPEFIEKSIEESGVYLELLRPESTIDYAKQEQTMQFSIHNIETKRIDEFTITAVTGIAAGTKDQWGDFYQLVYTTEKGEKQLLFDPLANSLPFGPFAPAEVYDFQQMNNNRQDLAHLRALPEDASGFKKGGQPINILQIHAGTASAEKNIAGLTRVYQRIAKKIETNTRLTPEEENFTAYDAIQLMPIEPIIGYEDPSPCFEIQMKQESSYSVKLRRPDMTNWGYDIVIAGSPAVNPTLLETGRPDEFKELIEVLHNFPKRPIKVILDIVYGHADNQGLRVLNKNYFTGPNMYGQDMNFRHPVVRAILLEMQKRKSDFGVDGLRVDGAQDFKYWDPEKQELLHDDEYLQSMSDMVQNVAGIEYKPWMIFEDGRPWPREDWELASTYRSVIQDQPDIFQWGPLTFAHNTPFLFSFWITKYWRIRETVFQGANWITGCANHDTLRRGTQVDPESRMNTYLGSTLPEVFKNGYDNEAANLFWYCFLPGLPMDFINASSRAPWSFIRNTDATYSAKIAAEESTFLDWAVEEQSYHQPEHFKRLKALGFVSYKGLKRFMKALAHSVPLTEYDTQEMAKILRNHEPKHEGPKDLSPELLKRIARAWMDDVYDFCNIQWWTPQLNPEHTRLLHRIREFRHERPWLIGNLTQKDSFSYLEPAPAAVVYFGTRLSPDRKEEVLFCANMEGAPVEVTPGNLPIKGLSESGWKLAISTLDTDIEGFHKPVTLSDSQGFIFTRKC